MNRKDYCSVMNRGLCKVFRGDKKSAIEDFSLAAKLQPKSKDVLFNKASMLFSMKDLEESEKVFSQVINLAPDDLTAYKMRGEMYILLLKTNSKPRSYIQLGKCN